MKQDGVKTGTVSPGETVKRIWAHILRAPLTKGSGMCVPGREIPSPKTDLGRSKRMGERTRGRLGQLQASPTTYHLEAWFLSFLGDWGRGRKREEHSACVGGRNAHAIWAGVPGGEVACVTGLMCAYVCVFMWMVLSSLLLGSPCPPSVALSLHPQQTHCHPSLCDGTAGIRDLVTLAASVSLL